MSLQIFISVRNSYDMESIINQKQKFITTKEDKLNHGIWLENVRRTVKKYDGDMRISQENERFIVTIN
ncbi:GHKL domain-containing protein, partial [Agathobacter rectalis]|uniref:GHKL domain-containing protein n=1 Tax=Agathobacter rectalis TaxID=39491 RepID=UPI003FD77256